GGEAAQDAADALPRQVLERFATQDRVEAADARRIERREIALDVPYGAERGRRLLRDVERRHLVTGAGEHRGDEAEIGAHFEYALDRQRREQVHLEPLVHDALLGVVAVPTLREG